MSLPVGYFGSGGSGRIVGEMSRSPGGDLSVQPVYSKILRSTLEDKPDYHGKATRSVEEQLELLPQLTTRGFKIMPQMKTQNRT
jgi:hypothetical protein